MTETSASAGVTLLLVRHGRTSWNAQGRAQGHADVPLDETGLAQAERLADVLAKRAVDRLWSSDLSRASQTAAVISARTGLDVVFDPRLREFDVGERQGLTLTEFTSRFPDAPAVWVGVGDHPVVPGAESTDQVRDRMLAVLRECRAALAPGHTGVVLSHGAALRVGLFELLGWSWEFSHSLRTLDNCAWAELRFENDGVQLAAYNVAG